MKRLQSKEASFLAFIAANQGIPPREFNRLLEEFGSSIGSETRRIARAVISKKRARRKNERQSAVSKTAQALRRWAETNYSHMATG